ncbi:hypothetical protein IJ556_01745, partial [bacterium]|nr:hypothetical protein [bacterium]
RLCYIYGNFSVRLNDGTLIARLKIQTGLSLDTLYLKVVVCCIPIQLNGIGSPFLTPVRLPAVWCCIISPK